MKQPASLFSAMLLLAIAAAHILRLAFGTEIVAGGSIVPLWPSALAGVVCLALGVSLLKERRTTGR